MCLVRVVDRLKALATAIGRMDVAGCALAQDEPACLLVNGHRMNERGELWRRTSRLASWSTATGLATWQRAAVETDELTEVGRVLCVSCG